MKNALLFLTASLWCITLSAQPGWQWGYEAGGPGNDLGYAIKTNANGTSYITGRFNATATFGMNTISSYGGPDVFVAKYTVNGNCLWAVHGGSTEPGHIRKRNNWQRDFNSTEHFPREI